MVCCGNIFVSRTFISGSKASIERTFQFAALEKNVVMKPYKATIITRQPLQDFLNTNGKSAKHVFIPPH